MADLDEFFASPDPGAGLPRLFTAPGGCLAAAAECAVFDRFDVFAHGFDGGAPNRPPPAGDLAAWLGDAQPPKAGDADADPAPSSETTGTSADSTAVGASRAANAAFKGPNTISKYVYRDTKATSRKAILDPNFVFGFFVHEGYVCTGPSTLAATGDVGFDDSALGSACATYVACQRPPATCAFVVHAINMFRPRWHPTNLTIEDSSWLWPLAAKPAAKAD